jgi:Sulfotransferase family
LFLVGEQRSATTALHRYLGKHPEIFMARKELHHFGSDLGTYRGTVNDGERPNRDQYLAYFAGASGELYLGDASVGYLPSKNAAAEIHDFCPDARIVASFRDPVDMLYSLYSLLRFQGVEDNPSFVDAINSDEPRWAATAWPFRWGFSYRSLVNYAEQLERYIRLFGPDRVHVVIYEEFKADTSGAYGQILDFLGVNSQFRPNFNVVNSNRGMRLTLARTWAHRPPAILRRTVRMVVPAQSARVSLGKRLVTFNERHVERRKLNRRLRKDLEAQFAGEVAKLEQLIGRDLAAIWARSDD